MAGVRGRAGHVIDEVYADAVVAQFVGIGGGETEVGAEGVEVIDDGAIGDASPREGDDIGESERLAMLHFCAECIRDAGTAECRHGVRAEARASGQEQEEEKKWRGFHKWVLRGRGRERMCGNAGRRFCRWHWWAGRA
jgi:hypothetical protein